MCPAPPRWTGGGAAPVSSLLVRAVTWGGKSELLTAGVKGGTIQEGWWALKCPSTTGLHGPTEGRQVGGGGCSRGRRTPGGYKH